MSSKIQIAWQSAHRWKRVLGASVALLLLTAVPASAIIYTGDWRILTNRATNGAPRAVIDDSSEDTLVVDMGVSGPSKRTQTSVVVARRTFTVEPILGSGRNRGEEVELSRSFTTELEEGTIVVTSTVAPSRGLRISPFVKNVRSSQLLSEDRRSSRFLKAGRYTLIVKVVYVKRPKGSWDNISAHTFSLTSV